MSRSQKYLLYFLLLFLIGIVAVVLYVNTGLEKKPNDNIIEATE